MRLYLIAIVGLIALNLATFAIISPYNGASNDEWSYLYLGQQGEWDGVRVNRAYSAGAAVIAAWFMPDQPQRIHVIHLLSTLLICLGLFHVGYRLLGGKVWFAFCYAAVYSVYFPYNVDFSRAFFIQPYSWALLLMVLCTVCLVEAWQRPGAWGWLALSAGLGYVSARVYEGFIPLLALLPLLTTSVGAPPQGMGKNAASASPLVGALKRRFTPALLLGIGLWWAVVGIGSLQFILPYLRGEAATSYQTRLQTADSTNAAQLLEQTALFFENTFPAQVIFTTPYHYLLPSLLLAGLFWVTSLLLWRHTEEILPSLNEFLLMLLIGLGLTLLGGLAFIYAGLHNEYRSQFIAAPGAALVVASLIGLLAHGLGKGLRLTPKFSLALLGGVFFLTAGQWSLGAQQWAVANRGPAFDVKTAFFRDALAFLPALEPHTALLYYCPAAETGAQLARIADRFAVQYLYGEVELIALPYHFAPLRQPVVEFGTEGIFYSHQYDLLKSGTREFTFRYDEVVVLGCQGAEIILWERFPPALAPVDAEVSVYNPYARFKAGFISPQNARMVAP